MTSGIDPITGLDTAINDPYLYQIPLTTNPIQAPEWGWRGHVDQVLYPDHIPSIFATAQGYDESNPGAAQAHHMDGEGNLYVNVRKNEAGGGAAAAPQYFEGDVIGEGTGKTQYDFAFSPKLIYVIEGTVVIWNQSAARFSRIHVTFGGVDGPNLYPIFHAALPPSGSLVNYATQPIAISQVYPDGLPTSGFLTPGDRGAIAVYTEDCSVLVNVRVAYSV